MKPFIIYDAKKNYWELLEDYKDSIFPYEIPAGFKCDLSSIKRAGWIFIAPYELSIAAPLVHDFCYFYPNKYCNRKTADKYFRDIMKREGVPYWRRFLSYYAVRFFAGYKWRERL